MNFRTSSYTVNGGNCVTVAGGEGSVMVRDTKDFDGGELTFPAATWERFTASLR